LLQEAAAVCAELKDSQQQLQQLEQQLADRDTALTAANKVNAPHTYHVQ
jgi:hypothetical protein